MESELEGRLAAYAKLCSAYVDGAYRGRGEAGLATDQAGAPLLSQKLLELSAHQAA